MYAGQKAFLGLSWFKPTALKLVIALEIRLCTALWLRKELELLNCLWKV